MELKLCPFCGNKISEHKDDCYFLLLKQNAIGRSVLNSDLDAAWNRRADSAALAAQNRELRSALETCMEGDYSTGHVIHPSFDEDAVKAALALPDLSTEPLERFSANERTRIADKLSELCYDDAAEVVRRMGEE